MCILQLADPTRYKIRAAFTLGDDTGSIYIEGPMDEKTQQLLLLIPGLLFINDRPHLNSIPSGRILYEYVPPSDAFATLKLPDDEEYQSAHWVKLVRGRYKDDVGFVLSVEPTGCATVLLVPRLQVPISGLTGGKRKRCGSIPRSSPQLFVPQVVAAAFGAKVRRGDAEGVWHFKGSTYEHGLLRKKINPGAAIPITLVPTDSSFNFLLSGHPVLNDISRYPRPMGWEFSLDERVVFLTSRRKGQKAVIVAVEEDALYVELSSGEVVKASWLEVRKDISVGNFVKVVGGPKNGKMGWVNSIDKGVLCVVENYGDNGSVEEVSFFFGQC
jgi:hypothetical protein